MKKTEVELESRIIQGAHGVAAEEDHIKTSKIVGIGAFSLAIFVVGCIWAVRIMNRTMEEAGGGSDVPAAIGQYEIGIVNQRMFEQDTHAERKLGGQHAALEQGWGDKPGEVVHPRLEQAMETVIAQERQARQPQPQEPGTPPAPQQ